MTYRCELKDTATGTILASSSHSSDDPIVIEDFASLLGAIRKGQDDMVRALQTLAAAAGGNLTHANDPEDREEVEVEGGSDNEIEEEAPEEKKVKM